MGPRAGRVDLHRRARSAAASSVESSPQPGAALPGRRHRPGQLGLAVRQGPLRLRGGQQRRAARPSRWCATATSSSSAPLDRRARREPRPLIREALDRRRRRRRSPCIGGARLTNEDAYAWAKLAKGVIGTDNVDAQLGDGLPAELVLGLPRRHHRRGVRRRRHRAAARARPQGRAAGPVPAPARRRRQATACGSSSSPRTRPALTALATVVAAPPPGRGRRDRAGALLDGPPPGTDAGGVDPNALATASQLLDRRARSRS